MHDFKTYLITEKLTKTYEVTATSAEAAKKFAEDSSIIIGGGEFELAIDVSPALQNSFYLPLCDYAAAYALENEIWWEGWCTEEDSWVDPDEPEYFKVESIIWCDIESAEDCGDGDWPDIIHNVKLYFAAVGVEYDCRVELEDIWAWFDDTTTAFSV